MILGSSPPLTARPLFIWVPNEIDLLDVTLVWEDVFKRVVIFFLTNIHVPLNLPSEIMIIFCVHHIHNTYDDYADDVDRKNGNDDNDENDEQCIQTMDSLRSAATASRTHAIVRRFILIIIHPIMIKSLITLANDYSS